MGERDRQRAVCTLGVNAIFSTPLKMEAFIRERSACLCLPALCLSVWPRVCSHSPFVPLPPSLPLTLFFLSCFVSHYPARFSVLLAPLISKFFNLIRQIQSCFKFFYGWRNISRVYFFLTYISLSLSHFFLSSFNFFFFFFLMPLPSVRSRLPLLFLRCLSRLTCFHYRKVLSLESRKRRVWKWKKFSESLFPFLFFPLLVFL